MQNLRARTDASMTLTPFRWLALLAGLQIGLVFFSATPVSSEVMAADLSAATQAASVAEDSLTLSGYAHEVAIALAHSEPPLASLE